MNLLIKIWWSLDRLKYKTIFFASILLLSVIFETLGIGIIYQILNIITDVDFVKNNEYLNLIQNKLNYDKDEIIIFILFLTFIIFVIKNTLIVLFTRWQQNFLNIFDVMISDKLFTYYINQPYERYLENNTSVYVRNLTVEMSNLKGALQTLITLITESIIIIFITSFLIYIDPIVTFSIFIILVLFSSFYFFGPINNYLKEWSKKRLFYTNKYAKYLIQGLASVKEIRVYQSEQEARSDHYNNKKKVNDLTKHLVVLNTIPKNIFEIITIFLIGGFITYFILNDKELINIVPLAGVYLAAAYKILPSLVKIINATNTLKFLKASIDYIYNELREAKKISKDKKINEVFKTFEKLEFKNVSFKYKNSKKKVLNNISIKIKKGEIIGIKGESGSGKSTLINLMLGLLKPTNGKILVNNKNLEKLNKSWLKNVSYVPQNLFITDNNIFKNVGFGKEKSEIDKTKVIKLLKKLRIYKDIKSKGLNKDLGERGAYFSGGQAQRVVIARALYKNPDIIFLDEATSGLDKSNEQNIFEILLKLRLKKTLIISSHNDHLLNICDYVIELKSGLFLKKKYEK
jgi:ATP-binding cassette, subfamily B, bacterial PglK